MDYTAFWRPTEASRFRGAGFGEMRLQLESGGANCFEFYNHLAAYYLTTHEDFL